MDSIFLDDSMQSDADDSFYQVPGTPIANLNDSLGDYSRDSGRFSSHSLLTPITYSSSSIDSISRKRKAEEEEKSDPFTPAKRNVAFSSTAPTPLLRPAATESVRKDSTDEERNPEKYPALTKKDVSAGNSSFNPLDESALKEAEERDNPAGSSDFLATMKKMMEAHHQEMMTSVKALAACQDKGDQLAARGEDILRKVTTYKEELKRTKEGILSRMNQVSNLISKK